VWHADNANRHTHRYTDRLTDTHIHTHRERGSKRKGIAVNSDCAVGVAVTLIASVDCLLVMLRRERARARELQYERVAANYCRCGNPGNKNNNNNNETKRNEANKRMNVK